MSKNKNIPELRFPEFVNDERWENKTLEEVSERIEEKVGDRKYITVSISAGIGFVSQKEKFSRDISGNQYKNYILIHKGDFSYNKGNSKKFPQGCIYKLKEFESVAAPNAFLSFRFKENVVGDFYTGYFDNNFHGKQLRKFITSGARMDGLLNISPSNFFSIILPTPKNINEQQKIASCLSSLDDLISAHSEKLDLLKAHKKGLMQNLFPQEGEKIPKYRFPEFVNDGEWEEKKLGNKEVSTIVNKKISINKLTVDSYISTENMLSDFSGVTLASKLPQTGTFTKFETNDILVSNIRPYLKKTWRSDKSGGASNDIIVFRYGSDVQFDFLEFILKNDSFISYIMKGAKGVKMPRGDKDSMREYPILIPTKQEQQKIASCLSSLDKMITAQADKTEQLIQHKKGLIQILFPTSEK